MNFVVMNQSDLKQLAKEQIVTFALPATPGVNFLPGQMVGILEPYRDSVCYLLKYLNGKYTGEYEETLRGVKYESDGVYQWENGELPNETETMKLKIVDNNRQSPTKRMPEYAVRRYLKIIDAEVKPLQEFSEDDIKEMRPDNATLGGQQLLMEEFIPIKNFENLYRWWKRRYRSTLKNGNNPTAVILRVTKVAE